MKNILFSAAFMLVCGATNAQKIKAAEVPATVKATFARLYPSISNPKWEKEGANYEAEFDLNKVENSASFDANGNLMETEVEISVASLPAAVTTYMATNVKGKSIKEASKITSVSGKVTYEAEAGGMDYIFDADGKFLKTAKD